MARRPLLGAALLLLLLPACEPVPVAPPVVVFAARGEEVLLRLPGYDTSGRPLTTSLVTAPPAAAAASAGSLHELSQLFVTQNLQPRRGRRIEAGPRGSGAGGGGVAPPTSLAPAAANRLLYVAPQAAPPLGAWANFTYRVLDGSQASAVGTVWVVPPHRKLVSSDFRVDTDGWRVAGKATLTREPYSRGALSQYLVATDAEVQAAPRARGDTAQWRFVAPAAFLGNKVAAYGGAVALTAGAFAGEFATAASVAAATPLIILECATCQGGQGVRLGHFVESAALLDGQTRKFSVPLLPAAWRRDPRNSLAPWAAITECDLVATLRALSGLSILGDWTAWYETIAIDDVALMVAQPWGGVPKACYAAAAGPAGGPA
jgi:hypothetical protein